MYNLNIIGNWTFVQMMKVLNLAVRDFNLIHHTFIFENNSCQALTHSHSELLLEVSSASLILLKITWE